MVQRDAPSARRAEHDQYHVRKFHHTTLINMTRDERSVESLLQTIDAHSVGVARKHYNLKDPQADANLAKELLKVTIKEHVPWPADAKDATRAKERRGLLTGGHTYRPWSPLLHPVIQRLGRKLRLRPTTRRISTRRSRMRWFCRIRGLLVYSSASRQCWPRCLTTRAERSQRQGQLPSVPARGGRRR